MRVVDKGVGGHPQDWVMGAVVGDPYKAIVFDREIDLETPFGPIYLVQPTVETAGKLFGMVSRDDADAMRVELNEARETIDTLRDQVASAEAEAADLRAVVERYYRPQVENPLPEPEKQELRIGQGKPGPGRPKKVTA